MKPSPLATLRSIRAAFVAFVTVLATVAGLLVVHAGAASAVTPTPTFEPDPASRGSIRLYDATGTQITSGSVTASPLAAYYVASGGALNTGDTNAYVAYATPQDGVPTLSWTTVEIWTAPSTFSPAPAYPGSIAGTTTAVAKGANTDGGMDAHIAAFPNNSAQNPGIYQIRLYTSSTKTTTYYSTDILVSGSTWTQVYPVATTTSTTVAASPVGHQTSGGPVTFTATVSPSSAAGTVQFSDGGTNLGGPVAVSGGTASTATSALAVGSHSITATFTPTDAGLFTTSASSALGYTIDPAPVAHGTTLVQGASATIRYGTTTSVFARLTDTTTGAPVAGAPLTLLTRSSGAAPFTPFASVATNAAGVAAVTVRPLSNTQYEFAYSGSSTLGASTSGVQAITVVQAVVLKAAPARVRHGLAAKLWGTVSPSRAGQIVYIKQKVGRTWRVIARVRIVRQKLPNGRVGVGFILKITPRSAGRYYFQAVGAATVANASGASSIVTIIAS